jgi:hypothetical protein
MQIEFETEPFRFFYVTSGNVHLRSVYSPMSLCTPTLDWKSKERNYLLGNVLMSIIIDIPWNSKLYDDVTYIHALTLETML